MNTVKIFKVFWVCSCVSCSQRHCCVQKKPPADSTPNPQRAADPAPAPTWQPNSCPRSLHHPAPPNGGSLCKPCRKPCCWPWRVGGLRRRPPVPCPKYPGGSLDNLPAALLSWTWFPYLSDGKRGPPLHAPQSCGKGKSHHGYESERFWWFLSH